MTDIFPEKFYEKYEIPYSESISNADAFKYYDNYKKATDIIERVEFTLGRRVIFKSDTGSTLNFEINRHGAYSTTAQNI